MGRQFSRGLWDATVLRMETSCSASRSRGRSKRRSRRRRRERSISFKWRTREATANGRCRTGGSVISVKATKLESLGPTTATEVSQWTVSGGSCGGGTSLVNETRVGNGILKDDRLRYGHRSHGGLIVYSDGGLETFDDSLEWVQLELKCVNTKRFVTTGIASVAQQVRSAKRLRFLDSWLLFNWFHQFGCPEVDNTHDLWRLDLLSLQLA